MNRRKFLHVAGQAGLVLGAGKWSWIEGILSDEFVKLTILHTNDVHSRLDPFPDDGGRNANKGGVARRMSMIRRIREEQDNVLLLDCGDILQGTPYFNMFQGKPEFEAMDLMGYDAATIGNHDYDGGIDLLSQLIGSSRFSMLNCNYSLENTPLSGMVKPYEIFDFGDLRVGITGVGIELKGLVPQALYGDTVYLDPINAVNKTSSFLKNEKKCDLVICLSHLGFQYREDKISDLKLASMVRHVDMILGGHTHTFLRDPDVVRDLDGNPVIINQVGWGGILLGRIDLVCAKGQSAKRVQAANTWVDRWS